MNFSIQSIYNWYRSTLRNPKYRWWIILGTLAYLISPFDIAPDFIPVIGQLDDLALVTLLVTEVSQMVLDYVKTRQASQSTDNAAEVTGANSAKTVDVDSIKVE